MHVLAPRQTLWKSATTQFASVCIFKAHRAGCLSEQVCFQALVSGVVSLDSRRLEWCRLSQQPCGFSEHSPSHSMFLCAFSKGVGPLGRRPTQAHAHRVECLFEPIALKLWSLLSDARRFVFAAGAWCHSPRSDFLAPPCSSEQEHLQHGVLDT